MLKQRLRLWQWDWNPVSLFVWRLEGDIIVTCGKERSWTSCSRRTHKTIDGAALGNYSDPAWWQWATLPERQQNVLASKVLFEDIIESFSIFPTLCIAPVAVWLQMRTIHLGDLWHRDKLIYLCGDLCRIQSGITFIYFSPNRIAALAIAPAARHPLLYCFSPIYQYTTTSSYILRILLDVGAYCISPCWCSG